jgi:hypothetical protein
MALAAAAVGVVVGLLPRADVGLLDHRVVRGIGVATAGVGVAAVAAVGVTALRRGVSTIGVGIVIAALVVTAAAGAVLLLVAAAGAVILLLVAAAGAVRLPWPATAAAVLVRLGLGDRVAVVFLGVSGVGVAAFTALRFGVSARGAGAALVELRRVALR